MRMFIWFLYVYKRCRDLYWCRVASHHSLSTWILNLNQSTIVIAQTMYNIMMTYCNLGLGAARFNSVSSGSYFLYLWDFAVNCVCLHDSWLDVMNELTRIKCEGLLFFFARSRVFFVCNSHFIMISYFAANPCHWDFLYFLFVLQLYSATLRGVP